MELFGVPGVYLGMFEQSVLIDHGGSQKTGAFAASFAAQICLAGVLIVIPLIFTDTLRIVPMVAQLPMLVSAPPHPPIEQPTAVRPSSTPSGFHPSRVFRAPVTSRGLASPVPQAVVSEVGPAGLEIAMPSGALDIGMLGDPFSGTRVAGPVREAAKESLIVVAKPPEVAAAGPVRVAGSLQSSKIIKRVIPEYPSAARAAHISGAVRLLGIIGTDGRIRELKVLDGPLLLRKAAVDAVQQWIYSPTILSGQAVEVEAPITVEFALK